MQPQINLKTVVLGTGGTIAGLAADPSNPSNYKASQLGLTDILQQAGLATDSLDLQDVAQIDSKDMGPAVWRPLLQAISQAQERSDVQAVVITHGTDTIEETAFLLEVMGPWPKPVVLTCAMQPADSPTADGPGNLRDALLLAQHPAFKGVAVVCAGRAHHPLHLQKIRTDQDDAFSSGLGQPLAWMQKGQWVLGRSDDQPTSLAQERTPTSAANDSSGAIHVPTPANGHPPDLQTFLNTSDWHTPDLQTLLNTADWPRVEWVSNHANADGELVLALLAGSAMARRPLRGIIVAATGAGTVSIGLEGSLLKARAAGVEVWVSSRCVWGQARFYEDKPWGVATSLNPAKAMVALSLTLLAAQTG
jgi:L-asparaginase